MSRMNKVFVGAISLALGILQRGYSEVLRRDSFVVHGDVLVRCASDYEGVVVLPREIKHIGDSAFSGCRKITGLVFHDSLQTVGESAFSGCVNLTEVTLPDSVTNIGSSAFILCSSLTNAVIRASIDGIPTRMFDRCESLRHVEFPAELLDVGESAFAKCRALKSVSLPESVTNISSSAFFSCSRLERFKSPEKLLNIGALAFGKCYDLLYLVLSKHIETIGADALKEDLFCSGIVMQGKMPCAEIGLLRDCSEQICIYQVDSARQEPLSGNAEGGWTSEVPVVECVTAEEAVGACEAKRNTPSEENFPGLTRVLRMAVDGFSSQATEGSVDLLKMDEFIAHIVELAPGTPTANVLEYAKKRAVTSASFSVRGGVFGVSAHFGVYKSNGVCVEMDLEGGILKNIKMSQGLKDGALLGFRTKGESPGEIDLQWLKLK